MNKLVKQIIESKFNFNIDIKDDILKNILSKSTYNTTTQKELYEDLYLIDLGLPSGTLWCKYNLGVDINLLNTPKDWYGNYYAWGETETKDEYTSKNYKHYKTYHPCKYCNNSKYGYKGFKDDINELELEDDAAYQNLSIGSTKFRMPNKKLLKELIDNTDANWVENYNDIEGLNGIIFKSINNNGELFIPAAGCYDKSELVDVGIDGYVWTLSRELSYQSSAYILGFTRDSTSIYGCDRRYGFSIRPILFNQNKL